MIHYQFIADNYTYHSAKFSSLRFSLFSEVLFSSNVLVVPHLAMNELVLLELRRSVLILSLSLVSLWLSRSSFWHFSACSSRLFWMFDFSAFQTARYFSLSKLSYRVMASLFLSFSSSKFSLSLRSSLSFSISFWV